MPGASQPVEMTEAEVAVEKSVAMEKEEEHGSKFCEIWSLEPLRAHKGP